MGKISLKKETKGLKLKPKPKSKPKPKPVIGQQQTQRVIVNVGSNEIKSKRQRKASGPIEKKVINQSQIPTTIYVPQAMPIVQQPQQSMNELINYLKQAEQHKEAIKEREVKKSNELEKGKKEEKRSEDLTRDEVQDNFSVVYPTSNISSLTGGTFTSGKLTAEPNIFSNLSSLTTSGTATPSLLSRPVDHNLLFESLRREADLRTENPNSGSISFDTFNSNVSIDSFSSALSSQPSTTSLISDPKKQTLDEVLKDTVVTDVEDPVIDQVLEEMPENQIVIYGPQKVGQTSTATEQIINPIDNSIPPPPQLRINKPLPTVRMADIIAANSKPLSLTQISQKEIEREARLRALEKKKPVIGPEIAQVKDDDDDDDSKNTLVQEDSPELKALKAKLTDKNFKRKDMVDLLSKNGITEKDGLKYAIYKKNVVLGSKSTTKTALTEHILKEFNAGRITKL